MTQTTAQSAPPPGGGRPGRSRELQAWGVILLLTVVVSLLHYSTAVHFHGAHGIYRRLYYFPIVLAAFRGGWRGGVGVALLACMLYVPHAYGWIGFDPAPMLEKNLEMLLYLAIGLLSGLLVEREQRALDAARATAADLQRTLVEKEAMERELVEAERLAAVGLLSAGLAHEIRNPLASIKGAAEVLAGGTADSATRDRLVDILRREADRLNDVLTRFLSFARPARGERTAFDLVEEVRQVVDLLSSGDRAPHLVLEAAGPVNVTGDRDQVRQAVWNVVLNACQFAGPEGHVTVSVTVRDGEAVVTVRDDGPGFPPEVLARPGTPFLSTREGGTGLGLAVADRAARDHGGRLAVRNGPGGGGEVSLILPREEVAHGEDPADRR